MPLLKFFELLQLQHPKLRFNCARTGKGSEGAIACCACRTARSGYDSVTSLRYTMFSNRYRISTDTSA